MNFIMTILFGIIGGKVALKFKVPAGAMIGAMFGVAVFNIFTGLAFMPWYFKIFVQIATGTFIGAKIEKSDVLGLKEIVKPTILMLTSMVIMNLALAYLLYVNTSLDIVTALFSTAPGGLMDMTLIANDLNADLTKVVTFQLIRLISVITLIPLVLKFLIRRKGSGKEVEEKDGIKISKKKIDMENRSLVLTIVVGVISGGIGYLLGVPAGGLSFSMIGAGAYNIITSRGYMPTEYRKWVQILGGALIGTKVTVKSVEEMKSLIFYVILVVIGFIIMNVVIGSLLYKTTNLDMETSLFSAAPGGASDIPIIASEMGADVPKVAIMQLARMVFVISFYPFLIKFIVKIFG